MKKNLFKRGMAGLLSLVMCLTALVGIGTTTAYAAGERAEVYLVSFPRSGDANIDYSGTWGHPNLRYMNGWHSGESKYTTIRAMHSYDGNICYCIEPGVQQDTGDTYTSKDETFWDNLPSDINSTISPYDMKLFIGRIMQYGYTGPISTSWRSQNPADAATLAEAMATQVLIWETVVGERDEDFDYVSPGSYDAVKGVISTAHPLYDLFCDYYDSIEASVQRHSAIPSFMSKNPNRAQSVELEWDGSGYTATLTDHNRVLSDYSFSANEDGISFSVNGNQLIITATDAPSDSVRITANKVGSTRRGIITWTDGRYAPGGGIQDVVSYAQEVNDPVQAFLNLKVSYGSAKIVKTSEDGKVDNLTFTVTGNGVNQTVKTNSKGEIQIDKEDNMLKITNDGRKLALDQRLINPLLPDFEDSKLNACVDAMFETWERGSEKRLTQLFFCDLSTPKNDGSFNVYDDIRQKLIARGVPADEIRFIHEADTEAKNGS